MPLISNAGIGEYLMYFEIKISEFYLFRTCNFAARRTSGNGERGNFKVKNERVRSEYLITLINELAHLLEST